MNAKTSMDDELISLLEDTKKIRERAIQLAYALSDALVMGLTHRVEKTYGGGHIMVPRDPKPYSDYDERHLHVLCFRYDGRIPDQFRVYCSKCTVIAEYPETLSRLDEENRIIYGDYIKRGYLSPYEAIAAAKSSGHIH